MTSADTLTYCIWCGYELPPAVHPDWPGFHRECIMTKVATENSAARAGGVTGADLLEFRTQMGWTQRRLGMALGKDADTVAKWERGDVGIGNPVIMRLALLQLGWEPGWDTYLRSKGSRS